MKLGAILQQLPGANWYPQTGPQAAAYINEADELFFGGSAGGGKSDLILGLAKYEHVNSLIIRKEATQLTGMKQRIQELMEGGDRWQGIGPHGGILRTHDHRMVELAGCADFSSANSKFRGRPHDLKAWDELPTIPQNVYEFINAWNRTAAPGQRCRSVAAGNPPATPEEEWVLDYWKPWLKDFSIEPGQLVWYARVEDKWRVVENGTPFMFKKEMIYPKSRTFIPATLADNPILESTGYRQVLQALPEPYRSQLLYGDMKIGLKDDAHQLIPTAWVDAAMRRWQERVPGPMELSAIGVDPARGGKDRTTLAKRYGKWVAPLVVIPGRLTPDGPKTVSALMLYVENVWVPIIIDVTGTAGGGLLDSFRLLMPTLPTYAFVAANKSEYRDNSGLIKMRNKRTEAYWRLRDALDPNCPEDTRLDLPPDEGLRLELIAQRWYMFSSGAGLDEKEEVEKRLHGKSPDRSDALAMTMMNSEAASGWINESVNPTHRDTTFMGGENPTNRLPAPSLEQLERRWV